jgi:hypothetical protein
MIIIWGLWESGKYWIVPYISPAEAKVEKEKKKKKT